MLINAIDPEESRIAVVEDGVLQELHVELASREAYLGNVYKGKVVNIEPSIGAAFVSFGGRVNGFLHISDVLPAYGRPEFQLNDIIEGRARLDVDDGPEAVQQALLDETDDGDDEGGAAEEVEARPARGGRGRKVSAKAARSRKSAEDQPAPAEAGEAGAAEEAAEGGAGEGFGADLLPEVLVEDKPSPAESQDEVEEESAVAEDEAAEESAEGDAPADDNADDEPPVEFGSADEAPAEGEEAQAETDEAAGAVAAPARGRNRRGRRRGRSAERSSGPSRRNRPTIDQLLKKGQEVVVQITKEGIGSKGPTLTTYVSLPGRSLVLMPSLPKCGVSRKIEDAKERRRLKRIVRELDETGDGGLGFIVRTAGVDKSRADLQRDRDYLKKIWEMVAQRLPLTRAPALLYQESDLVLKAMRDLFTPDITEVVTDNEDVHLRIKDFADKLMPAMADRIKRHDLTTPLFHGFGIENSVEALYEAKVDLPNGASIVIDQAEALVAIDVNSGKFRPGADLEETAYRTNLDSIPEIVRQLRLRDLGGLIIIDFIDMSAEKHRRQIERRLIGALRGDRARIKVGRISPFGMLEITRQRVGPGLKRTVFVQCEHCKGSGWSRTVQSKALSVLREIRALLNLKGYSVLQVFVSPSVHDYLTNYKRRDTLNLEDAVGKSILFRPEQSYPIDIVHYRFLTGDGQEARVAIPAGLGVRA